MQLLLTTWPHQSRSIQQGHQDPLPYRNNMTGVTAGSSRLSPDPATNVANSPQNSGLRKFAWPQDGENIRLIGYNLWDRKR